MIVRAPSQVLRAVRLYIYMIYMIYLRHFGDNSQVLEHYEILCLKVCSVINLAPNHGKKENVMLGPLIKL